MMNSMIMLMLAIRKARAELGKKLYSIPTLGLTFA